MIMWDPLKTAEVIQLLILITLVSTLGVAARQLWKQSAISKAQFIHDSFEMLMGTYQPITQQELEDFKLYPVELVLPQIYEKRYRVYGTKCKY